MLQSVCTKPNHPAEMQKKESQNNQDVWSMMLTTGICTSVRESLYGELCGQKDELNLDA